MYLLAYLLTFISYLLLSNNKKNKFFCLAFSMFFFCDCLLTSFLLLPYVVYTCMGWYEHIFIIITTQYCDSTVSIQASRQAAKLMGIPFFLSSYILSFLQSSVSSFSHITSLPFSQFSSVPFIIHTWPIIRTLALSFPICLYFIYIYMIMCMFVWMYVDFFEKLDYLPFIFIKGTKPSSKQIQEKNHIRHVNG